MKIMTILGTRPEIIRLSLIVKKLDQYTDHVFVHTGQNFDQNLSDVFFRDLDLRQPDVALGIQEPSAGAQIGKILVETESLLQKHRPDRLLLLGDTNSSLAAVMAKRLGIPVYHMEAGNRCFDDRVPEEVNRRIIDSCSDVLMPYTEHSRRLLLREGYHPSRIYVTGNPIYEVLQAYGDQIDASKILKTLKVKKQKYVLVTLHRAENVDEPSRLKEILGALKRIADQHTVPVIVSAHPRLRQKMEAAGVKEADYVGVQFIDPFGFFDFVHLEKQAFCVISDSGTVQEECAIFGVPNVTIRDVTERPETLDAGSNILVGADTDLLSQAVRFVTNSSMDWTAPADYLKSNVSDTVVRLLLSKNFLAAA